MRDVIVCKLVMLAVLIAFVFLYTAVTPHELYVAGHLYIRERGISAEVYTRQKDPLDGMSSLWNGGEVITRENLSTVQLGDMAEIYTVEGEHLVLECVGIRKGWAWRVKPQGDVIVINGRWMYRLTRL